MKEHAVKKLKRCSVMLHIKKFIIERFISGLTRGEGFTFMGTFFHLYFVSQSPVVVFALTHTHIHTYVLDHRVCFNGASNSLLARPLASSSA